jgi:hypothetical protein
MGKTSEICPKRGISRISQTANQVPAREHVQVKLERVGVAWEQELEVDLLN